MDRLKLQLEELAVESFETTPCDAARRGTVRGHATDALSDCGITNCGCTGGWCQGQTYMPCEAGTYAGGTCDSTCNQIACGCTAGGALNGTCDASCATCNGYGDTCNAQCDTYTNNANCNTHAGFPGCGS